MKIRLVLCLRRKRESTYARCNAKDTDIEKALLSCDVTTEVLVNRD